jgi:hypothetical protein
MTALGENCNIRSFDNSSTHLLVCSPIKRGVRYFCGTVHHSIEGTTQKTLFKGGMICSHCYTRGSVTTQKVKRKKGVSGAKITGALFILGWFLLPTGLSNKEEETEAHCNACDATWYF